MLEFGEVVVGAGDCCGWCLDLVNTFDLGFGFGVVIV